MGEAKRRKQLLGKDYGKTPKTPKEYCFENVEIDIKTDLSILGFKSQKLLVPEVNFADSFDVIQYKGYRLAISLLKELGFEGIQTINLQTVADLRTTNLFSELYGIYRLNPDPKGQPFNAGRLLLFTSLCSLLIIEASSDNDYKAKQLVRKAAQKLYELDGIKGLEDPLVWLFIPKSYHRLIDMYFDGIGGWRS